MTATATTTIKRVSLLTKQDRRSSHSFDLALSPDGIEVRRAGRPAQHLSWDRVSRWDIEERKGYVVLTLRGEGAATPLAIPEWTRDDLEVVLREVSAGPAAVADTVAPDPDPRQDEPRRRARPLPWKAVVTVVLLGLLATAVIVVLLQSAGIITWGFLGPTA